MTAKKTPMMAQWEKFRTQYDDNHVIAFRMGDFFEFFNDDAKIVSKILDITCTTRQGMPLAGFPYASGHEGLEKIVKAGKLVVVVDQVEDPKEAKGKIVKRDIVRVITPGTLMEDATLDHNSNNFLASVVYAKSRSNSGYLKFSLAFCDISTGEFTTTSFVDSIPRFPVLSIELSKFNPVEILLPENLTDARVSDVIKKLLPHAILRRRSVIDYDVEDAKQVLLDHFNITNLESLGIESLDHAISAAGALLRYLQENQKRILSNINSSSHHVPTEYMQIDHNTIRNLELLRNNIDGSMHGSLFEIFSKTCTSMGTRMVKKYILSPLMDRTLINQRLDVIEYLINNIMILEEIKDTLTGICDLERLISRINYSNNINARHLLQLAHSLQKIPELKEITKQIELPFIQERLAQLIDFSDLFTTLLNTFVEEPSTKISEGKMIRKGIHEELDELREMRDGSKEWLEKFQERMKEKYGITTLKVKKNKVFGYFIEVSKSHTDKVPGTWTRKQTLVNSERYINPDLKEMEEKILTAEEKIFEIEREIFISMRELAISSTSEIQVASRVTSEFDVMLTFAIVAMSSNYVRPKIKDDGKILLSDARHPTIEKLIGFEKFIPNDVSLNPRENVLNIVTGPNMSGKSTFLRQICLNVIMAQIGSFVPATQAEMGLVDKIFSRVGAMDDITRQRSTFLMEMNETAYILNHATRKSLVILDELGRGTSTFDGLSLAWSVAEYLQANGIKTLFATHYHQLSDLESFLPRTKNLNVVVKEDEATKELIFLHKVVEGASDKSYGIQVAKLAGIPMEVITRASDILNKLSDEDPLTTDRIQLIGEDGIKSPGPAKKRSPLQKTTKQTILFPIMQESKLDPVLMEFKEQISELDINTITPLNALNILKKFKDALNKK